jgi:parallel beta-helix repeat protein
MKALVRVAGFSGLAAVLGLAPLVDAQSPPLRTRYVDPAGSDTGDGSVQSPWRTLQRAADDARAGDLVVVRPGTYAGFDLRTSGTPEHPIVFRAEPGTVISTPNPVTQQDGVNLEGASHVTIEAFTLTGLPRAGIRTVLNHHVTIRQNTADANGRWGIFSGFSDDLTIEANAATRSLSEHGIYVSNSGDRPIIRNNLVEGNHANGIHMNGDLSQGGDGLISGALVEGNIIHDNGRGGGSGINADGVQNSRFQNNLLYDNHASGISLYRIDGADGSRNNVVAHNTIIQAADARWAINIKNGSTGNSVVNNILWSAHPWRGSISILPDSLPGFVSNHNVVMQRFTLDDGGSVLTLAQWRAATGQDSASLVEAPAALFVDVAGADYHLREDAPGRDAGQTLAEVTRDLEGIPRPIGPASDIGAYEVSSTPATATLFVSRTGTGSGTVTGGAAGINCGNDCAEPYPPGTVVVLTATPAAGSAFAGWSGPCSGTGSCTVTLAGDLTVGAAFTLIPVAADLVVGALGSPPSTVRPKGSFTIADTTRNQGTGSAASSTTRFYLSLDTTRGAGDQPLDQGRSISALGPDQASSGSTRVKVPARTPSGTYYLLGCADAAERVPEGSEANNCLASATRVRVTR